MRIAMFVINSVAADGRVIKEAASLTAAGHDVVVAGMWEAGQPREDVLEGFRIVRLRPDPIPRDIEARSASPGPLRRALEPLRLALALLDFWARAGVWGARQRVAVCHAHDLSALPAAWWAARRSGARLVYDAHELFTEMGRLPRPARVFFRLVEARLIRRADAVITVNPSIATELARRYGVAEPLVVRNCPRVGAGVVARERSPLRAKLGLAADVPIVLYQGMFMPHRGLEGLVEAARDFDRAHLVLMGWGYLRPQLEALIARLGLADRVHLTDGVPLARLLDYTAGADLGVIPYLNVGLNNYLTSPNKLFEYCAAGVPVVASHFPELARVIEGHGVGATFDASRPEQLAATVNELLAAPEQLDRLRANVRAAASHFSWEGEVGPLLALYEGFESPAP